MTRSSPGLLDAQAAAHIRECLVGRRHIPRRYQYLGAGAAAWAAASARSTVPQLALVAAHAADVAALVPEANSCAVFELGPGDGRATALILNALSLAGEVAAYSAVDISPQMLDLARAEVRRAVRAPIPFNGHVLDFTRSPLPWLVTGEAGEGPAVTRLALCLGGTLSNFDDPVAVLSGIRRCLRPGDFLVVSQRLDTPSSRADVYPGAAVPPSERAVFDALGVPESSHRLEAGFSREGRYRYHRARFVEDVVLSFEPFGLPDVVIAEGEAVEVWRSQHFTAEEYCALLSRGGFAVARVFLDATEEYLLAVCERREL